MSCKPTYKGKRYNSLEELYKANGVSAQQALQLYSEYLEQNPNGTIEGFKQWNNRQQQINELFESDKSLANGVYEALGFTGAISLESNLKNTGKTEQDLINYLKKKYPEIKLNITNNPVWEQGDNVFNQEEYNNQVQYRLKAVNILLSDKAKQIFDKGEKAKWSLNKILTELQIPKEQKQLLLDLGIKDREQLAFELASKYGYSIEINVAKESNVKNLDANHIKVTVGDILYKKNNNKYFKIKNERIQEISKEEFEKVYINEFNQPTQHYSNLTVPGGTNYTENEISTPLITPNIKGHAQFATDKGIGWFRSDDRSLNQKNLNSLKQQNWTAEQMEEAMIATDNNEEALENYLLNKYPDRTKGDVTKTRRILEVQSDLFQKGRDKENLIYKPLIKGELFKIGSYPNSISYGKDEKGFYKHSVGKLKEYISEEEFKSVRPIDTKNQFLQLLNKNNNWVTFFIKSIIQDSAKKGYEKVLFPKGDTAAKIEGHQTLEEFKRQKEDRIKQLEQDRITIENYSQKEINHLRDNLFYSDSVTDEKIKKDALEQNNNEINQLKQELTYIESGKTQLSSIAKFYEETVINILKKQGYNPVEITDEYGNTWNEISLNQARDLANILLQRNEANQIIGQANIKAMTVLVDAVNKKADTIPHEYAHHYIAWFRNTPIVQEGIKRWGSEEALVQAIGEQVVKQKGEAYNWWKKFTNFILNLLSDKQLLQVLTDSFLNRTDLNSDFTYNQITPQQKQQAQQIYSEYLNTIFPDSKVRDIVYHGANEPIEGEKFTKREGATGGGIWFSGSRRYAQIQMDRAQPSESLIGRKLRGAPTMYQVVLNIKNPKHFYNATGALLVQTPREFEKQYDRTVNDAALFHHPNSKKPATADSADQVVVFEPEQIHILGSKQDIEGFKAFVESNNTKTNNSELIDKNTESEIKPIVDAENKTIKNNYETFKEVQDFFDSNLSTMDNIYNAIFNNSEITPDDIIKQIIKTDNVEKECNGGVSDSSWEIV